MDNLKKINDDKCGGHALGSSILKAFGVALKEVIRTMEHNGETPYHDQDTIYRIGGDEFLIIINNLPKKAQAAFAQRLAEQIEKIVKQYPTYEGLIGMSFGIANTQETIATDNNWPENVKAAIKLADRRMYEEKNEKKMLKDEYFNSPKIKSHMENLYDIDPSLKYHSEFVKNAAEKMGILLNFDKLELAAIKFTGLLHDIGKESIKKVILKKEDLTLADWEEIKTHTTEGERIAKLIIKDNFDAYPAFNEAVVRVPTIIRNSHENMNCSGYEGLPAQDIPIESQIIRIIDSFHAMISARVGMSNGAKTIDEAITELRKGAEEFKYNQQYVEQFINNKIWEGLLPNGSN